MTEKGKFVDRLAAAALGAVAFVLLLVWSFPGIHPTVWNDTAINAGLLPTGAMLPGLGGLFAYLFYAVLPFSTALAATAIVAKLLIAVLGALVYRTLLSAMEIVSSLGARDLKRRRIAARVASFAGAALFVCSDPVWTAAQQLTGTTFVITLVVVTAFFYVRLLQTARPSMAIAALSTAGLLAAESPIGWLVLGFCVWFTFRFLRQPLTETWRDFVDPVRLQRTKWLMTFVFLAAFMVGVGLEFVSFVVLDGNVASGITVGELPVAYCTAYWRLIATSTGVIGICPLMLFAFMPFVIAAIMVGKATDELQYLSFKFTIIFLLAGAVAFMQLSPFSFGWYWAMIRNGGVVSRQLIAFTSLLSAITIAYALFVMGVEIFCRDYVYIESTLFQMTAESGDDDEDDEDAERERPVIRVGWAEAAEDVDSVRLTMGRLAMLLVPLLLVTVAIWGRRLTNDRTLCRVMYEFIDETITEAIGSRYLFTDGSYDAAIRIEAKRRGVDLVTESLMSGNSRRDIYIRQQAANNFEDKLSLEAGAAEALRTWVTAKSEILNDVAVQLAFEIFRINRHLKPIVYGCMVKPAGGDARAAEASVERCHQLADRIVNIHEQGIWRHASSEFIKDRFLFAQFRLAVMSRLRAINLDSEKKAKESLNEIAYSDRLNQYNPSLIKILKRMDWVRRQSGEALTPREGLEVAMKRADFTMARRYAMPVLKADPDEPNANFAVGMSYYAEEQYAKAEEYLKRVLKKSPNEPAVYNNLALLLMKTGRFEEAEKNVVQALKLFPESPEIKDTARQIQKAKAERKGPNVRR